MKSEYQGSCHCGAIGYRYRTPIAPDQWSIRACQCRFCRAHDALSASDPNGFIEFTVADPKQLNRYRFGLKTADFLLCRECGVYIGALIETENGQFGIINTHALLPVQIQSSRPNRGRGSGLVIWYSINITLTEY